MKQRDNILILSHANPDLDTLGSGLGLRMALQAVGKRAAQVCADLLTERQARILDAPRGLDAEALESGRFAPDYVIAVDTADPVLLGGYTEKYAGRIDLVIDHHATNKGYGRLNYVDAASPAAGQIIFEIVEALGIPLTPELARPLYAAIADDTGSFRYQSTSPATHTAAARLISTGLDFARLNRLIFQCKSAEQIAVERLAYNNMEYAFGDRVCVVVITDALKEAAGLAGAAVEDIHGITHMGDGVEVGVLIKQTGEAKYKVSLRSNEYADVSAVAARFGGGGHVNAAGCTLRGDLGELRHRLLDAVEAALRRQ